MRLNTMELKRPKRLVRTRTFTEQGIETPLELTLRQPDAIATSIAAEETKRLVARYVEGETLDDGREVPAFPLLVGGEPVWTSRAFWVQVVMITCLQLTEEELEYPPYTSEEMGVIAATFLTQWPRMVMFAEEMFAGMEEAQSDLPKALTVA